MKGVVSQRHHAASCPPCGGKADLNLDDGREAALHETGHFKIERVCYMKIGSLINVRIEDLAFGGEGVARHEGQVVFVPFAAIGDQLRVRLVKQGKRFWRAELDSVLEAGPGREAPRCRYFTRCGGCQYQHLAYSTQLAAKEKQLRDALERLGGLSAPDIQPWLTSPQVYGYRNRISVHQEGNVIGFRAGDNRTLVDIEECPLASMEVNQKLQYLRRHPGRRAHYSLREQSIPMEGFYQSNRYLLEKFRALVTDLCLARQPRQIVECYGGSGFFTESLAAAGRPVQLVEKDPRLVAEAHQRLPQNVTIHAGECENILENLIDKMDATRDLLLVDPPREGLSERVKTILQQRPVGTLVYVSCNPATLARDLKSLHHLKTSSFYPVDLFPQTYHIECIALCRNANI